ncbi:MAG: flagellar hook protein FlgE [Bdellovibrionales bacterium]|nr:flagellar hook protein FlgE [Bdellovibrionales bacterium]
MPSIVNGLFSGRSGISSHGAAIAVVGDNIANSSTIGFKASRAEFEDLIAGGQTSGKVIGSGSSNSAVSTIFEQGTLEFTSRPLDLAIDGNGFFVVRDGNGQDYYTRAGNFKINQAGVIVDQNEFSVLGFPEGGSGALEEIDINDVSQSTVATTAVTITGNVDAGAPEFLGTIPAAAAAGTVPSSETVTYSDLNDAAEFSTVLEVFDSLGASHTVTFFFFHTDAGEYTVRGYVNSEDVDGSGTSSGYPRQIATTTITFGSDGDRTDAPVIDPDFDDINVPWNNGSSTTTDLDVTFDFTSFASSSNVQSLTQNGQGIGAVTSISIEENGNIFALLSNGQSAVIGTIGMINFSNPEGLTRIGNNLLQQSANSGEPIVGTPLSGTFGGIQSGSIELSTVDIANEFVKIITLQRGFQANSRIITTINQLLNEIISLA